jgi:squalene synthase HpnD
VAQTSPNTEASTPDLSDAWAHVHRVVEASGSSFISGMKVLPEARREAMYAIYAYCREIDDIADDPLPYTEKQAQLADWRVEIDRLYDGAPTKPTARALEPAVRNYDLRKEDFIALIDGMDMDAKEDLRAPSMEELKLYCARVAGAVGLLSVRVFGETAEARDDVARSLGLALQLTNILRDICEDAERGRLYLPRELLSKHGIDSDEPGVVLAHPNLPAVCTELADLAEQSFKDAQAAMALCSKKAMRPAIVMMHVYHAILERLIARGWSRIDQPVHVPKLRKIWIALRYGLF